MIEQVEITTSTISHLSSVHYCRDCGKINDIELAFVALTVVETPELFTTLSGADRLRITSIAQAQTISSRLDISNPRSPMLTCEQCGKQFCLHVRHEVRTIKVPAFLSCGCGQEVDLRYPGDSRRVRFTSQFPGIPFLHCRSCKRKMLIPLYGKDSWRIPLFRVIRLFRRFTR